MRLAKDGYWVNRLLLNEEMVSSELMSHIFSFDFKISLAMPYATTFIFIVLNMEAKLERG